MSVDLPRLNLSKIASAGSLLNLGSGAGAGFLSGINPIFAGIGLLGAIGGRLSANKRTAPVNTQFGKLASNIENMDISQFKDIAREAAPSYQDLSRLSAATGGSMASANAQVMQGQTRAMDAALRAYQQQQMANQGLLANIYGQQYAARQSDLQYRRQTGVDVFSNIANLGFGLMGQQYGSNLQATQNQNFFDMMNTYKSTIGG